MIFVGSKQRIFNKKLATTKFLKQLRLIIREKKSFPERLADKSLSGVEFEQLLKENAFELQLLSLPASSKKMHLETFRKRLLCESEKIYNFRRVFKIAFIARHF